MLFSLCRGLFGRVVTLDEVQMKKSSKEDGKWGSILEGGLKYSMKMK